ncbi:hypothetical protein L1987_70795 [Smallanthus sonchifolius]|uniref:Uncharacterized protein n=1 Tax=Smallanthus sonchifolius TaxID=185202 RepID=A0ACB9APS9_9ASTR|nr:hypothetical protein L1987_70795 [Smallanthus sonchifolius]
MPSSVCTQMMMVGRNDDGDHERRRRRWRQLGFRRGYGGDGKIRRNPSLRPKKSTTAKRIRGSNGGVKGCYDRNGYGEDGTPPV